MEKSFEDRNWINDLLFFFKNLWLLIITMIVGIILAWMLLASTPSTYRAHATYYLNKSELNSAFFTINEFQFYNLLLLDIEKLIESRTFYEEVKAATGVDDKINQLSYLDYLDFLYIESDTDSTFFKVGYDSPDQELAMKVSNRIESILSREAAKIIRISTVEIVDGSYLLEEPVAPGKIMFILFGAILGAFVGMSVILIKFLLSKELKTYIEAEVISGKKVLSYSKYGIKVKNIMHLLNSMNQEDYHFVWQTINNDIEHYKQKICIVVTSDNSGKNEAFALTFAHYMGRSYEKTLFIPINPSSSFSSILTYSYGHENRLIKALIQNEPIQKLIRRVSYSFDILTGTDNRIAFNQELLEKFESVLDEIEKNYDLIILSISAEEWLMTKLTNRGSVILAASNNSNRDKVRQSIENFEALRARFLGIAYQE